MTEKRDEAVPPMYAFGPGEKPLADLLLKVLHAVLRRPDLDARFVSRIAMFLKACERLPLVTPGVGMTLTIRKNEVSGGGHYQSMRVDEDSVCLDEGTIHYDPAVGSDHESRTLLEIGDSWRNSECGWGGLKSWIASFISLAEDATTEADIEDFAESEVDWNDETIGDSYWDQLEDDEE